MTCTQCAGSIASQHHVGRPRLFCDPCRKARKRTSARAGRKAHYARNREAILANLRSPEGRSRSRASHLRRLYGMSVLDYERLLASQGGVCRMCGQPESAKRQGLTQWMSVDHDHACCPGRQSCGQCLRGLLCLSCNKLEGLLTEERATMIRDYRALFADSGSSALTRGSA